MTENQIRVERRSAAYWRASFEHPPINLIDPQTIVELDALVSRLESDPEVRVIVFDSTNIEFYLAHYDVLVDKAVSAAMKPGPTGLYPWPDVLVRLSRAPVVSVASLRGRARGAGSEFALACDVRFGSRERCILGQFEVGVGAVPGGGPMARLSRLVGRGRALEILLGADDFPGDLAERYGYINRAVPDRDLDDFVDAFARRLANFDKRAIVETKRCVDKPTLPDLSEFEMGMQAYFVSAQRPETGRRLQQLVATGLQQNGAVELNLGKQIAENSND